MKKNFDLGIFIIVAVPFLFFIGVNLGAAIIGGRGISNSILGLICVSTLWWPRPRIKHVVQKIILFAGIPVSYAFYLQAYDPKVAYVFHPENIRFDDPIFRMIVLIGVVLALVYEFTPVGTFISKKLLSILPRSS